MKRSDEIDDSQTGADHTARLFRQNPLYAEWPLPNKIRAQKKDASRHRRIRSPSLNPPSGPRVTAAVTRGRSQRPVIRSLHAMGLLDRHDPRGAMADQALLASAERHVDIRRGRYASRPVDRTTASQLDVASDRCSRLAAMLPSWQAKQAFDIGEFTRLAPVVAASGTVREASELL